MDELVKDFEASNVRVVFWVGNDDGLSPHYGTQGKMVHPTHDTFVMPIDSVSSQSPSRTQLLAVSVASLNDLRHHGTMTQAISPVSRTLSAGGHLPLYTALVIRSPCSNLQLPSPLQGTISSPMPKTRLPPARIARTTRRRRTVPSDKRRSPQTTG
jgi:hypothetical protein